jgi:hypothetical protein
LAAVRIGAGQDELSQLLGKLDALPLDYHALDASEAHPSDPRIGPALEAAFPRRSSKDDKLALAATLVRLGSQAESYFDFLADYARVAIEDRTPSFMRVDANGHDVRGEFSREFQNWCVAHGKDPKAVAAVQSSTYPKDLAALAGVQDPRAVQLFRKGLESAQPLVVAFSVEGLGRLQDQAALPLIAKACDHVSEGTQLAIATNLPWFGSAEADRLLERLVPGRKIREFHVRQVQSMRLWELQRILARTGRPPAKQ